MGDVWPCACVYACMYALESLRILKATSVCILEMAATVNSDFRSWQKWNTTEIKCPAKLVKQTQEKWILHIRKMIENHFKCLPRILCSSGKDKFMSAELRRNYPDDLRTQWERPIL